MRTETMRPLLSTLVLALACSADPAPRLSPAPSTVGRQSFAATVALKAADTEAASYTTPWAASSRLGDTVFYSRGRVITTVAVHTDSLWVVRPPVSAARVGIAYCPSQLPPDSLCTMGYTATTLPVVPKGVPRELDRIHECHAGVFAQ